MSKQSRALLITFFETRLSERQAHKAALLRDGKQELAIIENYNIENIEAALKRLREDEVQS